MINLFLISPVFSQSQGVFAHDSIQMSKSNSAISLDSTLLPKRIYTNFSIGFRAGLSSGKLQLANAQDDDKNKAGIGSAITIFTNYKINSHFSIQPELNIGRYRSNNTLYKIALLEGVVDYTLSTYDLHLLGVYSYSIKDWFSLSLEAGGSVARLKSSFGKVLAPNIRIGGLYDVNSDNQFEKLNYGAIVGLNPSFNFKNVSLQTSIRYRHGLNNINTFDYRLNRYLADSERTIQTRDIIFQIGFLIPIYKNAELID